MTAIAQATPSQLQWHQQHRARILRLGGTERSRKVVVREVVVEAVEEAEPEPVPEPVIFLVRGNYPVAPSGWKDIVREVCANHGFTLQQILGAQRQRRLCSARHEAFYRLSTETTMSLPEIGDAFGGRDHTTVLHGIRKHKARMERG